MAISSLKSIKNSTPITWEQLYHADFSFAVPFELKLEDQKSALICDQIIRLLPQKRLVAFGVWQDKAIVAKIFYGRKAKEHVKKELAGLKILSDARIPTPTLLYQGALSNKVQLLIFERILGAKNIAEIWQEKNNPRELMPLLYALMIELATQHVLGVVQKDLHLKNFLMSSQHIYTLDGNSIEYFVGPLSKKASLAHLSLFFAQLGVGVEELQQSLFRCYAKARGWILKNSDRVYLQTMIKKYQIERWKNFEKKLTRNCSAFAKIKGHHTIGMYDRDYTSAHFLELLAQPEKFFQQPDIKILKAGRSATVIKVVIDNKPLVIKRYNIKNAWHALRRCLRPSRAAVSWRLAQIMRLFGVATAKPIAFVEHRFLGFRGKAYFVMEYVEGMHLGEFFQQNSLSELETLALATNVIALFKNLAKLGMSHGDLKMTNILINQKYPLLLDLDGTKEHRSQHALKRAYRNEIQRFMRNWKNKPTVQALFEKVL